MNLPIGAFILVVFIIFVHPPSPIGPRASSVPWPTFSRTLDLPGAIILTAMILCLQLALQWGGVKYQWNNGRIISLLTISGVLFLAFLLNEKWQGDNAMLPGRILGQRNVICAILYCFCNMGSQTVLTYYLPMSVVPRETILVVINKSQLVSRSSRSDSYIVWRSYSTNGNYDGHHNHRRWCSDDCMGCELVPRKSCLACLVVVNP